MGLRAFLIQLDNKSGRFVSDPVHPTLVTGRVVLLTGNTKLMDGVQLHFRGDERIVWHEKVAEHTVPHRDQRKFFSESLYMFGGAQAGTRVLVRGRYSYPFSVTLPPDMPSSLRVRKGGRSKYTLEAVVGSTGKAVFNTKREIRVIAPLPRATLPAMLAMMTPMQYSESMHFWCLCCRSGPLTVTLRLPSRGVVVGRDFPVTVEADNASSVDVLEVVAKVKKHTSTYNWPRESKTVCRFSFGAVPRRRSVTRTVFLPSLSEAPVNVDRCQLIDVAYEMVVTAHTSRCHEDLRVSVPVKFLAPDPTPLAVDAEQWRSSLATQWTEADEHQPSAPPPPYEWSSDGEPMSELAVAT